MRVVERRIFKRIRGLGNWSDEVLCRMGAGRFAQLVEQRGIDVARIEDCFETASGQLMNLRRGQINPVALGDPRTNVAHDLLDVHMIATRDRCFG